MHESPDYYSLKVSVFNDDKKTDLIGETWIDLNSLIIPGGGQSDQWHGLQFKGKYAGDIRVEMTYYDTRPEDEAVIEKRKEAAERIQSKSTSSPVGPSSLSGPRQPRPIKRRPLPDDPTGASPSQSLAQDHSPQAATPLSSIPPRPSTSEYARPSSRHADVQLLPMQSAPRSQRYYNSPDDFAKEKGNPSSASYLPDNRMNFPEQQMHPYHQSFSDAHAPHGDYADTGYEDPWSQQPGPQASYNYSPESEDPHGRYSHEPSQPYQRQAPFDGGRQSLESMSYAQSISASHAQPNGYVPPLHRNSMSSPAEQTTRRQYSTSPARQEVARPSPLRHSPVPDDEKPSYGYMQPTVEDEQDDGPPPPPPVHRSSMSTAMQRSGPSPGTYKPYPQEYSPQHSERPQSSGPSPSSTAELDLSQSGMSLPSRASNSAQARPYSSVRANSFDVPASLIAGYATANAGVEQSQSYVDGRSGQVPISMPALPVSTSRSYEASARQAIAQPPRSTTNAADERNIVRKARSTSPDPRSLPQRKSISPQPPSVEDHEITGVPFSPDSFDALNPRRSPSATRETRSRYNTPDRETEPGKQNHTPGHVDDGPIIGDDGREIDPSDHLPSETWAPEPERKNKKPEVIIRFRHAPQNASNATRSSPRENNHQSVPTTPDSASRTVRTRLQKANPRQSYGQNNQSPTAHTPPHFNVSREYERHDSYGHQRNHSTPATYNTPPRHSRSSVSPTPNPQSSPLYALEASGPPIPAKVPIAAPVRQNYQAAGMDALSQEMQSIDIGSSGWDSGRSARRYAPRATVLSNGYSR